MGCLLRLHLGIGRTRSRHQTPQAQVVDDILDSLDVVLYGICPLSENVVLEVEQLESRKQVLEEGAHGEGQGEIAEGDGVGGEAAELLGEVGEGEEVLLNGDVEGVAVLEVDGHAKDGADLLEGEEVANVLRGVGGDGGEAAEPRGVEGGADGVLHGACPA